MPNNSSRFMFESTAKDFRIFGGAIVRRFLLILASKLRAVWERGIVSGLVMGINEP